MSDPAARNTLGVSARAQPARGNALLALLRWIYAPMLSHRRALSWLNLIYFGAFLIGVGYSLLEPSVQRMLFEAIGSALASPTSGLAAVGSAYLAGDLSPPSR